MGEKRVFPYVDSEFKPAGFVMADDAGEALMLIPPHHGLDLRDLDDPEAVAQAINEQVDYLEKKEN